MEPAVWAIIGVALVIWFVTGSYDRLRSETGKSSFVAQSSGRHAANYRRLYGSHIAALKGLHRHGGWTTVEDLRRFFDRTGSSARGVSDERPFEQWFEGLVGSGYVELVPNGNEEIVMITPFGVEFVGWMYSSRVPELKPG